MLNLLRGTGPEGLAGIPPVRGRLIRPLLQTPRQEIEAYLTAHGLGHVEDETNDSMDFTRNRLRQEVWPLLVTLHPAPERSIARAAAILRRENVFLDRLARSYLETAVSDCPSIRKSGGPETFGDAAHAVPDTATFPGTLPERTVSPNRPLEDGKTAIFRLISHRHPPPYRCLKPCCDRHRRSCGPGCSGCCWSGSPSGRRMYPPPT